MYLQFIDLGIATGQKTHRFSVLSGGSYLGVVKWYAPWRRYVLFPETGVLFDYGCMTELATFVGDVTQAHKEAR